MNRQVQLWVDECRQQHPGPWHHAAVLEIGSRHTYPSVDYAMRAAFPDHQKYVGIDLLEGEGVDMVMDAHQLAFKNGAFDVVLCLEMLEHDSDMEASIAEAHRVLRDKGVFILTTTEKNHGPNECEIVHDVDRSELLAMLGRFRKCYLEVFLGNGLHGWAIK